MERYIDADKIEIRVSEGINKDGLIFIPMRDVQASIDRTPTADVTEIRHGYWFFAEYEYFSCSECGESYFNGSDSTAETRERLAEGNYYPYCPHCGAKMDAEPPKKKGKKQ